MKRSGSSVFSPFLNYCKLLGQFTNVLSSYLNRRLFFYFYRFEKAKHVVVGGLTAKRGKYVRPFLHTSMTGLFLVGMAVAPLVKEVMPAETQVLTDATGGAVLGQSIEVQAASMVTTISKKTETGRDAIVIYTVKSGETLSSIAEKFGLTTDTIRWQNNLQVDATLDEGQELNIPPIDGVVHKVKRGDTIYSIAKNYSVDPQVIVNWPFNTYTDDENFGLAVGQLIVVPDGVKPRERIVNQNVYIAGKVTPNAGTVAPSGSFIWPAGGRITQRFVWYHQGLDIANSDSPDILAADAGTIVIAGWPDNVGYGNRVLIDHGNGFATLYAHLQAIYVTPGQTVNRGDALGKMGSTGRSTGTHLHFEIRYNGANYDPLSYLQ